MKKVYQRSGPFLTPTLLLFVMACLVLLGLYSFREKLSQKLAATDPVELKNSGKNLVVSMELTSTDVNHIGLQIRIDGWQEGLIVQNVWLQDANSKRIELQNIYSTQDADDSHLDAHYDLIPKDDLRAGRFMGQIVVQVGTSPMEAPVAEYKFEVDANLDPTLQLKSRQTDNVGGISVLLELVEMSSSSTTIILCYDKPTPEDWIPGRNSRIEIANTTVEEQEFILLFDADTGYNNANQEPGWVVPVSSGSCGTLRFPLGHDADSSIISLTIDVLERSSSFIPPSTDIQKAQDDLKRQGIVIEIISVSEPEGSGNTWNILQKPEQMDYSEADQIIRTAMGFYFHGPWSFTFITARELRMNII